VRGVIPGHDPQGNPRTIAVTPSPGLVVWHSREEWERLTRGVVCLSCGEPIRAHAADCVLTKPCQEGC
jgi:hypothetical protein